MTVKKLEEFLKSWREDLSVVMEMPDGTWRNIKIDWADTNTGAVLLISPITEVKP